MLVALQSVVSVISMIGVGFALARKGWFGEGAGALLSRMVVTISLPAYMIANIMGGYDRATLLDMLPGLPVPFAVVFSGYVLAVVLARLFKVAPGRRGVFRVQFAQSNTIFIGLPVNMVLFGEASLPYVLMAYIANTTTFWTLGVHGIAMDGARAEGRPAQPLFSAESLKRIFSPPLTAFLVAVLLVLAGIGLPRFVLDTCRTLGAMTTPLSMLFIGIVIAKVDPKRITLGADLLLVAVGRVLIGPLLLVLIARPLDLPPLMKQVFLIQAAMPAMTQTPILAGSYGADAEFAGLTSSVTTVLGLASIPIWMMLVQALFG